MIDSVPDGGLRRAVRVMDVLRSPGGCPWDAQQTHESLTRYLVEECYEVLDAIEAGDLSLLREELGDLLLQVLFHARLAEELPVESRFDIDDVANDLADKLIRRHPHVFGDETTAPSDVASLNDRWEQQKIREKGRTSALDGIATAQPALALVAKMISRTRRAGLAVHLEADASAETEIGRALLDVVEQAVSRGVDPEGALRSVAASYRRAVLSAENDPAHAKPAQ